MKACHSTRSSQLVNMRSMIYEGIPGAPGRSGLSSHEMPVAQRVTLRAGLVIRPGYQRWRLNERRHFARRAAHRKKAVACSIGHVADAASVGW